MNPVCGILTLVTCFESPSYSNIKQTWRKLCLKKVMLRIKADHKEGPITCDQLLLMALL